MSEGLDTLAGMVDSQSHPSGGPSSDEAKARHRRGEAQLLPQDLDETPPGPALGLFLSMVDLSRLPGEDVITVLRAQQRQVAHYRAGMYEAMAEAAYRVSPNTTERGSRPNERALDEIAAALTYTRRKTDIELNTALRLTSSRTRPSG